MVAVQENGLLWSGALTTDNNTPLLATGPVPQQSLFPITKWRPRTGLTLTQFKFRRDLTRLLAAFGLQPEALYEEQPTLRCTQAT